MSQKDAGRIDDLLINRHREGAERLKLLPTQIDREVFRQLLTEEAAPATDHRLIDCYRYVAGRLTSKDDNDQPIDVERVFEVVRTRLQVVAIGLDADDDPYEIFESLNYKGASLTPADLVRNHVLMRFKHGIEPGGEQERVYATYWQPLEAQLGSLLTDFLRHYCSMEQGEDVLKTGVYAAVKKRFTNAKTIDDVYAELNGLKQHAGYYACFRNPQLEQRPAIAERLKTLGRVDVSTSYPLLMTFFAAESGKVITQDELRLLLQTIESYVLRRMICGVPSNSLGRVFAQLARDCPKNGIAEWLTQRLLSRSTRELEQAIRSYLDTYNADPKPFIWTKSADDILASIERFCLRTSDSRH